MDIAISGAIVSPVKLLETLVTVELLKDAIAVNKNIHVAADISPLLEFIKAEMDFRNQVSEYGRINFFTDFSGFFKKPDSHNIGVGIIFQSFFTAAWKCFMKFIRSHHSLNVVLAGFR